MWQEIQSHFALSMPTMPIDSWWVAAVILVVLGAAAAIDMVKGIVPDPLIFFGVVGVVAAKGLFVAWPFAAHQLTWGILTAAIIWGINELWFRVFKHDALGLGDAKWSMLAVTTFGAMPVVFAWGIGASLGSIWILAQKIGRRPQIYVHFAPFLFVGLLMGIWAFRLDGWDELVQLF